MELLELLFLGSGFFLLCLAVFIPLGHLIARHLITADEPLLKILLAPAISSLGFSALIVCLIVIDIYAFSSPHNSEIGIVLLLFTAVFASLWFVLGAWREWMRRDVLLGVGLVFLSWMSLLVHVSFPNGDYRLITAETVMYLSDLPIDNVISYNVGRYLTERIDPNSLDVVPLWKATDRGPIAGILSAGFQLMLGLEDKRPWLWTGVSSGFVYQALLMFLNLLSLFGVWILALRWKGLKASAASSLILLSMAFFLLNVFFTWPKFFMAYVIISAWALWPKRNNWTLLGVLLGLALLIHNSAAFYILGFGVFLFLDCLKTLSNARQAGNKAKWIFIKRYIVLLLGAAALIVPWSVLKTAVFPSSPRLVHLQLFCNYDLHADKLTLLEGFEQYLSMNSPQQILDVKIANLLYPISVLEFIEGLYASWPSILPQVFDGWFAVFSRLIIALSIPACIVAVVGVLAKKKVHSGASVNPHLWSCIGAYLIASMMLGCMNSTVNHHWAYPTLLVLALLVGIGFVSGGILAEILTGLGVVWNMAFTIVLLFYVVEAAPALHATSISIYAQAGFFAAAVVICLLSLVVKQTSES